MKLVSVVVVVVVVVVVLVVVGLVVVEGRLIIVVVIVALDIADPPPNLHPGVISSIRKKHYGAGTRTIARPHNNDTYGIAEVDFIEEKMDLGDSDTKSTIPGYTHVLCSPTDYSHTIKEIWPEVNKSAWTHSETHADTYTNVRKSCLPTYLDVRIPVPSGLNPHIMTTIFVSSSSSGGR